MVATNKRIKFIFNDTVNGVDAGGAMSCRLQAGHDNTIRSAPDGTEIPMGDRVGQFVRGTCVTQDWVEAINLLTGVVGTKVFYQRKSGTAAAAGYVKHTLTNPVIHRIRLSLSQNGYLTVTYDFECRFAEPTDAIDDVWTVEDAQAAPAAFHTAARGGFRVKTTVFTPDGVGSTPINLYHVTAFDYSLTIPLDRQCNDADVGYTCVDAYPEGGMTAGGSLTHQDAEITAGALKAVALALAGRGTLVLTVAQGGGAADKVITAAGVDFGGGDQNAQSQAARPDEFTSAFDVFNDATTPLTLAGANKIITIADAA